MLVNLLPFKKKGGNESFEIFYNHRDAIVNIPVDEDQEVPDPRDSSLSMNLTHLVPYNCTLSIRTIDPSS